MRAVKGKIVAWLVRCGKILLSLLVGKFSLSHAPLKFGVLHFKSGAERKIRTRKIEEEETKGASMSVSGIPARVNLAPVWMAY
jgi:hypothetical protein